MFFLTLIIVVIANGSAHLSGWDDAPPPDAPEVPANVIEFDPSDLPLTTKHPPRAGHRYRAIYLPPEISRAELERYRHTLTLSDEQFALLESLFERYEVENKAFQQEHLRDLWELAAETGRTGPAVLTDPAAADAHVELMQAQDHYIHQAVAIEQKMFDSLQPILTLSQQARMPRVQYQRKRARLSLLPILAAPAAVDLSELLYQLHPTDPLDHVQFQERLIEYERLAAQHLQDYSRARQIASTRGARLRAQGDADGSRRLSIRSNSHLLRLMSLNERYAKILGELLPDGTREAFDALRLQTAYPSVYPDPFDFAKVVRTLLEHEQFPPEPREAIEELATSFTNSQVGLTQQMVTIHDALLNHTLRTNFSGGPQDKQWFADLDRLQAKRATMLAPPSSRSGILLARTSR